MDTFPDRPDLPDFVRKAFEDFRRANRRLFRGEELSMDDREALRVWIPIREEWGLS